MTGPRDAAGWPAEGEPAPARADPSGLSALTAPERIDLTPTRLRVTWADKARDWPARDLRLACKCGDCRRDRLQGSGVHPADVALTGIEPAGSYGVQLFFSDGHDRGIYPWPFLRGED